MIDKKNHIEKDDLHKLGIYNNYRIRDIKEDRLNIVQTQTKSKQNIQPKKTIKDKKNIINNRLLLKPNKKFKIEPETKGRETKSRPVESEYNDKIPYYNINPTLDNYYNYPIWMQYYNPYISLYDLPVLVPTNIRSYEKSSKYKTRSHGNNLYYDANTNYSIFGEPIPIVVRKKKKNNTIENFRLPSNFKHQNRVTRTYYYGSSKGLSKKNINSQTRLMRYDRNRKN